MSAYFLDSSALVKRYISETGTRWIQAITSFQARNKLIIARISWVEVLSALVQRCVNSVRVAQALHIQAVVILTPGLRDI